MIQNLVMGSGGSKKLPKFDYTGQFDAIEEGKAGWRIKLLTSGILTFFSNPGDIDVFMVGGGGGATSKGPAGGGGGYTSTSIFQAVKNVPYEIIIGDGGAQNSNGGTTQAFGLEIAGGFSPYNIEGQTSQHNKGGDGGSGGGWGTHENSDYSFAGGDGGSDGADGEKAPSGHSTWTSGTGQHTTTREFGAAVTNTYIVGEVHMAADWLSLSADGEALVPVEGVVYSVMTAGDYWYRDFIWNGTAYVETDTARVYAGGGGGGGKTYGSIGGAGGGGRGRSNAAEETDGLANTGGGAGGGLWSGKNRAAAGGSGIVVIRNHREVEA